MIWTSVACLVTKTHRGFLPKSAFLSMVWVMEDDESSRMQKVLMRLVVSRLQSISYYK
jgi:hypothetical protein